jgi:hypothetical protein
MTDGEIDANPTVRIQSDRESDQMTCGVHPTAQNMAGGENELLTSGDNPTADMQSDGESGLLTSGRRERGPPVWMQDYVTGEDLSEYESNMALIMSSDPIYFEDAVKVKHWRLAMDSEINAIEKNNTWTLNELPEGAKKIGVKWVYKTKYNEHGDVDKYKARLVAKGYSQQHGIDYTEVFAPVARMDTVRMIIALAAQKNWIVYQLDVKSAFLHGELHEDVYVDQPKGYEKKGSEHLVYKLHKALYGLKQAPRAWFSRMKAFYGVKVSKLYSQREAGKERLSL